MCQKLTQLLKKLKRKKAAGNDDLWPGLLKRLSSCHFRSIKQIINLSFRSGVFPSDWKISKILPLCKNGAADQFGNYRQNISFTSNFQGCWENCTQSVGWLLIWEQTVIEASIRFSCEKVHWASLTLLGDDIRKNADSKLLKECVFIDFWKAFDTISHAKLLQKLNACGYETSSFRSFRVIYLIANS